QGRGESLAQMVEQVNYGLRGWANYYAHTHASRAFDKLQAYANRRLLRHLRRRRQKSGLGRYKEIPDRFLYEKLGLAFIRRGHVRYVTP
ncbi:MAG: group II intron maturase-specific domain-containing protein, partial [Actinomycetota bacterium]